ncbi:MAG: CHAT domain-containing protein [Acidobacteriota bacterium]
MPYIKVSWPRFINSWAVRSIITLLACAPMLVFAQSTEETALRALAENFFAAYQKEDIEALQSMMVLTSPDFAATKQQIQKVFADNEKIEIKGLTVRKLTLAGAKATLRVSLEMSALDAKTKVAAAGFGTMDFTLRAVKQDLSAVKQDPLPGNQDVRAVKQDPLAGNQDVRAVKQDVPRAATEPAWKVSQFLPSAEDLAGALVAAKTDEERKALLAADPDLVTLDLRKALLNQAIRFLSQENYPQVIAAANLASSVAEQIGEKAGSARALNLIGMAHKALGNYPEALDYYQRGFKLGEQAGDKAVAPTVLNNAGLVLSAQGNYARALESFQKSLVLSEEAGNKPTVSRVLNNLGLVHYMQGNYAQALEYFQKGLTLKEQLKDRSGILTGLNNIGQVHATQGNSKQALEYYQRSQVVAEELGNKEGLAAILINVGEIYGSQNSYDLALKSYQRSLALAEVQGAKEAIAQALSHIAGAYYSQGNHEKSLEFSQRAGAVAKQIGSPERLLNARTIEGKAHRSLNRFVEARQAFQEAIDTIETVRGQLAGNEQQQEQFFENKVSPYQAMVELLIAQSKNSEALAYAERAKARMLLDVLRSGRVNIAKAMTAPEQERERKFSNDLVTINNQISREASRSQLDPSGLATLKAQLQKARLDYEAFQATLYAAHPELKVQRGQAQPVTVEEISALLPDAGSALLEYVVTDENVYLFVATRTSEADQGNLDLKAYLLEIKRKDLIERAGRFRKQLAARDLGFRDAARALYDLLLRPAQAQINGKTTLVVVPDDVLWELPFQALLSAQNRFLLEDYAISYTPSLTVLREMLRLRKTRSSSHPISLLAMGNPALGSKAKERLKVTPRDEKLDPLPEAENEVKALAQLYGASRSKVYVGAEAREDRLKAEASKFTLLHLATHGILNDASPMYSQIVLSQDDRSVTEDGLLESWEIMKLDLKADLVVLSACETARGRVGAGEGVIGLTWALFVAGSPTTVVSQWKVDSASTTQLMLEFHRKLKNGMISGNKGIGTARALQQAAMKLLRGNEYRHPFYWAGFVVMGAGD